MRYRHSDFSRDVEDVVRGDDEVDKAVVPGGIGILIECISKIYACTLFNGRDDFIKSVCMDGEKTYNWLVQSPL